MSTGIALERNAGNGFSGNEVKTMNQKYDATIEQEMTLELAEIYKK